MSNLVVKLLEALKKEIKEKETLINKKMGCTEGWGDGPTVKTLAVQAEDKSGFLNPHKC